MIDSHCHLTDERLLSRVAEVISAAVDAGVKRLVTIATTPQDAEEAVKVADAHEEVFFTAGIHPNNSMSFDPVCVNGFRGFAAHPKCVALGEMGLDDHWKDVPLDHQRQIFRAQLELAGELGKPIVIHSREAIAQTLEVLRDFASIPAVFHCFTGTPDEADAIIAAGYYIGFTGPLTYKRSDELRGIAARLPAERLLIETDAPWLTPEPHRSIKTNEPKYVARVLETLAKVRGISVAEADAITTANTTALYRLPQ